MPFIRTTVNCPITEDSQVKLKERLGLAITLIPGKSENSLMLEFNDHATMYFRGKNGHKMAFVEVMLYGSSTKEYMNSLTEQICLILQQELDIDPSNTYVRYDEVRHWGCNLKNF